MKSVSLWITCLKKKYYIFLFSVNWTVPMSCVYVCIMSWMLSLFRLTVLIALLLTRVSINGCSVHFLTHPWACSVRLRNGGHFPHWNAFNNCLPCLAHDCWPLCLTHAHWPDLNARGTADLYSSKSPFLMKDRKTMLCCVCYLLSELSVMLVSNKWKFNCLMIVGTVNLIFIYSSIA